MKKNLIGINERNPVSVTSIAKSLSSEISPGLKEEALANQKEILDEAGGMVARIALGKIYGSLVDHIPEASEIVCDRLLTLLGNATDEQILTWIHQHREEQAQNGF